MAKLLLDEYFFNRDNSDGYIDEVIKFIFKYFEDDIVFFHPYCNQGNLWMLKNQIATIEMKVMKKNKVHICDLNSLNNYIFNNDISLEKFSIDFIKQIDYVRKLFDDVIVFIAPENYFIDDNHNENVYLINHIKKELDSNIAYFIANQLFAKNIINPQTNSPLPNIDLCNEYKILQDDLTQGKNISDRIPIYLKVCEEVLLRNSYTHNNFLSSINTTSKKIRKIYQTQNPIIYGSIDVDTGSIEICDRNGHHIDEFGFDNKKHNKHDSTGKHDIKLHK